MFQTIYIEHEVESLPYTQNIIQHFKNAQIKTIDKVEDYWGRVKKPYLQKRDNLNLYVGRKKGQLIKKAPDAYGTKNAEHYYFIHAYNCIYECEYCYLQGYFHTPDIVLYVNHEEIRNEMLQFIDEDKEVWFHAGEFSDSLALSHITNEWRDYWLFFQNHPKAKLELRTKSSNIKPLLDLPPISNIIITFSLSPEQEVKKFDHKTASLKARLKAIQELSQRGFQIGLHFDPVIYSEDYLARYRLLFQDVFQNLEEENLNYISLGVVRFPEKIYHQVQKNYPQSQLLAQEFIVSKDGKVRYPKPMRMKILNDLKKELLTFLNGQNKVYLCMED